MSILVFLTAIIAVQTTSSVGTNNESRTPSDQMRGSISQRDIYRRLLKHKRQDHAAAVQSIAKIDDFVKQYRMIELVLDKLFQVLREARSEVNASGWQPDMAFPEDEGQREALAKVIENTLLFGDILLKMPDMTHEIFKSQAARREVIVWSLKLCNETDVFELPERKLLNLMSQELGVIPMEDNYVNPYRIKLKKSQQVKAKPKKKQREPREKKPRLSGRRLDL